MGNKKYGYDFISFLNNSAVVKVSNKEEFNLFKKVLETLHIAGVLGKETEFEDWQHLAVINKHDPNLFLFEYDNYKGLTWSDNIEKATDWYGLAPLDVKNIARELDIQVNTNDFDRYSNAYDILLKKGYDKKHLSNAILSLPNDLTEEEIVDLASKKLDEFKDKNDGREQ